MGDTGCEMMDFFHERYCSIYQAEGGCREIRYDSDLTSVTGHVFKERCSMYSAAQLREQKC